mmetsp:Transcript_1117/g.1715  ORF Transcript_1117/g.1715 Transcript_1117/m.1715 type:complete len:318 (+) Transcript_1117:60-1013(+)
MSASIEQRNQEATCYCGNLEESATEEILWELMIQAGPVVNVHMPRDKVSNTHQGYGFVEFRSEEDAEYAIKVLNMVKLFGKPLKVNKATQDRKAQDVGANLFIGQLDPEVDEKLLYDTFSAFGFITNTPKVMRDPDTGASKGYGFVSYDGFEASDLAIECMNGQYLCNRQIVVQYAFKRESHGERHGSLAERLLAANNPLRFKPHTMFASEQGQMTLGMPPVGGPFGLMPPPVSMGTYNPTMMPMHPGMMYQGNPPPVQYGAFGSLSMPPPPPPHNFDASFMRMPPPNPQFNMPQTSIGGAQDSLSMPPPPPQHSMQ